VDAPREKGGCHVAFRHEGLSPELACYADCDAGWVHFLGSIIALVERGPGRTLRGSLSTPMSERSESLRAFERVVKGFSRDPRVELPGSSRRGFGSNSLKVGGRIFAMFVSGALVVKLPRERIDALIRSGRGVPFDTGRGRVMKEWVAISKPDGAWLKLAKEARTFVEPRSLL
jgi:hypothetical protein